MTAKGSAKIVWLNLINDKYFFIKWVLIFVKIHHIKSN
jgi:hypothetical protein